jgi:hypothetical protein
LQVALIFLPMLPFSIADALNVMIAIDLAGVLLGWRRFDHFGHLGGQPFRRLQYLNPKPPCCCFERIVAGTNLHIDISSRP